MSELHVEPGAVGYSRRQLLERAGLGAAALTLASELELAEAIADAQASHHVGNKALRALRRAVDGRVLTRGQKGYSKAHKVYNTRFNGLHPSAVVQPKNVRDVQAVMKWADKFGVNVRARAGGHSYAGYSTTDSGVVVDLRGFNGIRTSNQNRTAQIGAGVGLLNMYLALAKKGVTIPGGSCPSVGISGLALGGGMGFSSRHFGLTCDNITGVSIVTPDGKLRKVDAKNESGLLWACQGGGGGNFGIVTNFTFKTYPTSQVSRFSIGWEQSAADAALAEWQHFIQNTPQELCPFFGLSGGSGQVFAGASGMFFGSRKEMKKLLKPLLNVGGETRREFKTQDYGDMMVHWANCGKEPIKECAKGSPVPFYAGSDYVHKALDSKGRAKMIDAIKAHDASEGSASCGLDAYGGVINKVHPRATAFIHRDQLYCIQYGAYPTANNKTDRDSSAAFVRNIRRKMSRFVSGQAYQNYIDPTLKGWKQAYYGANYERLSRLKKKYDPDNRMKFKQGIKPAR